MIFSVDPYVTCVMKQWDNVLGEERQKDIKKSNGPAHSPKTYTLSSFWGEDTTTSKPSKLHQALQQNTRHTSNQTRKTQLPSANVYCHTSASGEMQIYGLMLCVPP